MTLPSDESSQPAFEDSLAELETIVHDLEEGQLSLAEALARYEAGVKHLKHCYQLLQDAERKIELLTGVTDSGEPLTEPFGEETQALPAAAGKRRRSKPPRAEANSSSPPTEHDIDG